MNNYSIVFIASVFYWLILINIKNFIFMSEIALSNFLTHRRKSNGGFDFYPQPTSVEPIAGRLRVLLGNVPLGEGVPHPRNALTFLYGFRDALEEMKAQYALADQREMSLIKVEFSLPVGDVVTGSVTPELAVGAQFLNVRRFNDELKTLIIGAVNKKAMLEPNFKEMFGTLEEAGTRPDLLCNVLREQSIFSALKAVVYPVPNGTRSGRQVATLFTTHGIVNLKFRGDLPFNLELPLIGQSE